MPIGIGSKLIPMRGTLGIQPKDLAADDKGDIGTSRGLRTQARLAHFKAIWEDSIPSTMLCNVCVHALTDREGYKRSEYDPTIINIGHHRDIDSLWRSMQQCQVCHAFWSKSSDRLQAALTTRNIEAGATRLNIFQRGRDEDADCDILRIESVHHSRQGDIYLSLQPLDGKLNLRLHVHFQS